MKYSKKLLDKIYKLISTDDYTIQEICDQVGISRETYNVWKNEKSYFSDMIQKANDARLEMFKKAARNSMFKKINGYDYDEVTTVIGTDKDGKPKIKDQKKVKKHVPPDTAALIFILSNADKDNFKNTQFVDHNINLDKEKERVTKLFPTEDEWNQQQQQQPAQEG